MFEFLKECNNLNIYSRAHDCEIKLNAFDCVTPMAVFFESVFKVLHQFTGFMLRNLGHQQA